MDEPPIRCVRTPQGLAPVSIFDADRLERYAVGTELDVTPMQERWPQRQRFYWAALSAVHENLPTRRFAPRFFDPSALHDRVKVALGHVRHYISRDDKLVVAPGSTIVRGNAGRGKVQGLCRFAFEYVASDLIPGLSIPDLRKEAARRLRQRNSA
jgi:hypothetical protein